MRALLVLFLALCTLAVTASSEFYVVPAPRYDGQKANYTYSVLTNISASSQSKEYHPVARIFHLHNPIGHWHVYCPHCTTNHTCGGTEKTNDQAEKHGCLYASNGGPFVIKTQKCLGPAVVTDGVTIPIRGDLDMKLARNEQWIGDFTISPQSCIGIGLGKDGKWRIGELQSSDFQTIEFENFLCGFYWLVKDGVKQRFTPGGLIAPRTAIGIDSQGHAMMLEVDGAEDAKEGLTNAELADYVASFGFKHFINLDGGGSSVTYLKQKGGVQGCPTCVDVKGFCCTRFVTTIVCVSP